MADIGKNEAVDPAVLRELPKGSKVLSMASFGTSKWTRTNGHQFHNIRHGNAEPLFPQGKVMLRGEFAATNAIFKAMPSLVPRPHAWGKLEASFDETWFFLCDFLDLDLSMPNVDEFTKQLAELHHRGTSENGMFGFDVPTCDGALPHRVAWEKKWSDFYANLLQGVLDHDTAANGHWDELDMIVHRAKEHMIPRLLGALQSEGRSIKPSLIHGDMYEGNVGTDRETDRVMLFDASSYYAHNEMELGLWRWNDVMRPLTECYLKYFPPSEPVKEWDDRNRLYSVKTKLNFSADHSSDESRAMRRTAYEDLLYLCEKYTPL